MAVLPVLVLLFGSCDMFNNSAMGYIAEHTAEVRVAGVSGKTNYAVMTSGTILIPPGNATIGVALINPQNFTVIQNVSNSTSAAGTVTSQQTGSGEIVISITGAVEGDNYDLILAMKSPDGLRDFPSRIIKVKCARFFDGSVPTALDTYLKSIQTSPGSYVIAITGNGSTTTNPGLGQPCYTLASGVTITLGGNGSLAKTEEGQMFRVGSGAKLVLNGPTLNGANRNRPVVQIAIGGEFEMSGGTITGSNNYGGYGGGVWNEGTFTMSGGTITGNHANGSGGGVYNTGTFNLNLPAGTGNIYGNTTGMSGAQVYNTGTFLVNGSPGGSYD
jgi:hypothetical protein